MSTKDYNLSDYGFVITKEAAAYIVLALDRKEGSVPNDVQRLLDENKFREVAKNHMRNLPEYYADYDVIIDALRDLLENDERIVHAPNFTGTAECILHEYKDRNQTFEYDDEYLIYVQTEKEPSLFSTAYPTQDSLIEEYKTQFKNILPEDFNYAECITKLKGIYYS